MKSLPLAVLAFSLFLIFQAQARLGETPAEIAKRYGQPTNEPYIVSTNKYMQDYHHGDYKITVRFGNGKCIEEDIFGKTKMDEQTAKTLFKTISGKEPSKTGKVGNEGVMTVTSYEADGVKGDFTTYPDSWSLNVYDSTFDDTPKMNKEEKKKALEGF